MRAAVLSTIVGVLLPIGAAVQQDNIELKPLVFPHATVTNISGSPPKPDMTMVVMDAEIFGLLRKHGAEGAV